MARTSITAITNVDPNSDAGAAATPTAADAVNFNQATFVDGMRLIAYNSGVGAQTVTITSAPDTLGRTNDITAEAIAAGAHRQYGPFSRQGWKQADGKLYFAASDADVEFIVLVP